MRCVHSLPGIGRSLFGAAAFLAPRAGKSAKPLVLMEKTGHGRCREEKFLVGWEFAAPAPYPVGTGRWTPLAAAWQLIRTTCSDRDEAGGMDRARISEIAEQWMIPTSKTAYMAGLEKKPVIATASGVRVIDTEGKEYLDFGSGQMAAALGHNHPRYVAAVQRSLRTISHSTKTFLNVDRLELHERLGQILTPPLQKSLFLVSGSDAIEAAIDLARKATGGVDVLGLHMALHGSTSFITRSLTFGWNRSRHGLAAPSTAAILSPFCYRCPVGKEFPSCDVQCLASSMELADANLTGKPAAMIIEPVMSAGGIVVPPPGYVKLLKEYCRARDMLLIMDESQTGLGKTGKMWGHLHEDVVPDIMTVSKHFGAGLPISAVCTTAELAERAVEKGYFATRSHACDPIACAAGVASIDIVLEENLSRARRRNRKARQDRCRRRWRAATTLSAMCAAAASCSASS